MTNICNGICEPLRANNLGPEQPLREIKSGSDVVRHRFQEDYSSDDRKDQREETGKEHVTDRIQDGEPF